MNAPTPREVWDGCEKAHKIISPARPTVRIAFLPRAVCNPFEDQRAAASTVQHNYAFQLQITRDRDPYGVIDKGGEFWRVICLDDNSIVMDWQYMPDQRKSA